MGDFRKEYVQCFRLISREKFLRGNSWRKKNLALKKQKAFKAYNPGKNRCASGKKNSIPRDLPNQITHTPQPPLKLIKWLVVIADTSSRSVSVVVNTILATARYVAR